MPLHFLLDDAAAGAATARPGDRLSLTGTEARFTGCEEPTALLSDSSRCLDLFGPPEVDLDTILFRVVDRVRRGEKILKKPTKYQVRDGKF